MSQVSYGTITIDDITDITDVYFEYALVDDSISEAEYIPSETSWSETYPTWQIGYQIWKRQVKEKEGASNEYGTPFLDTAVNQLNSRAKYFWNNSTGTHVASGNSETFNEEDSTTYGFNALLSTGTLDLRYNGISLTKLDTSNGLSLYIPVVMNNVITGAKLGARLNRERLDFVNPETGQVSATLSAAGLKLTQGGIEAGTIGQPNGIYLSTEPRYGISINGHSPVEPTESVIGDPGWKQIIGSKFGVDADGTLYANNANISGHVDMTAGTISYGVIIGDAQSVHISLNNKQIGFWRGSEDNDINKTAYITNQYMYIPYTVVLNEMQVGTKPKYKEVENYLPGSNPSKQKWYEIINEEYVLTTDTNLYVKTEDVAIDVTKTYYILNEGNFEAVDNPVVEDIGNYYEITSKIYYTKEEDIPLWSWRKMDNGNLRLMWLGGEV